MNKESTNNTPFPFHRYSAASKKVLDEMPNWKKLAVLEDLKDNNHNSRFVNEYAARVIEMAENETISLTE